MLGCAFGLPPTYIGCAWGKCWGLLGARPNLSLFLICLSTVMGLEFSKCIRMVGMAHITSAPMGRQ